ncbi:hypothetical protein LCGC14_1576470 [marine sediment metagenome]|uniref:Uncharacterized protein n=1 Tax=marine sediment metagenome TaxID=412755 RepID=A0A0F9J4B3_9ZZZZ
MRRILRDNLWMIFIISMFMVMVLIWSLPSWAEQKPLTPEQQIQQLDRINSLGLDYDPAILSEE